MLRVQNRDPQALADLYDRFGSTIYRIALAILHDTADAEDVTQDIFLRIWNRPVAYEPARRTLRQWIVVQSRCRAIDCLRSRENRRSHDCASLETLSEEAADASFSLLNLERCRVLEAPWKALQQNQRHALRLAYVSGLSQTEIAAQLQRPLGTVKSWIRRGLESLRAALEDAVLS